MVELSTDGITTSNQESNVDDYSVELKNTDAVQEGQGETEWENTKWSQYLGYYKSIPELKAVIDAKGKWTIGKGFKADERTTLILERVSGWGMDTFNTILKNMIIVRQIGGDSFAEIIRDPESGEIINLKPLDPGTIKIIVNREGRIKRYEQMSKTGKKKPIRKYEPTELLHLTKDRIADEIHGVSIIEAVEKVILARNETFDDVKKLMHRYVKPMMKFILDTDDETKIANIISTFDAATNKGENLYIPKGTVEHDLISVPSNSTLNPLPWMNDLKNFFFQAVQMPQIILGGSQEFTESTAKIAYLAFQQSVEDEQMDIEAQILSQLGLKIELEFPASLQNELLSDERKDSGQGDLGIQPNDTIAGRGR